MSDLNSEVLPDWERISSLLKQKTLLSEFFFKKIKKTNLFSCFSARAGENAQLRVAVLLLCSGKLPESLAVHAPFQDLFLCGQRPLIQPPQHLTSTRRPAPRHSRPTQPITARALPRASAKTSDTIYRRLAAIGW